MTANQRLFQRSDRQSSAAGPGGPGPSDPLPRCPSGARAIGATVSQWGPRREAQLAAKSNSLACTNKTGAGPAAYLGDSNRPIPEHRMPLRRAIVTVASTLCAMSTAFAAETRLPACTQSMIVGTWQAYFSNYGIACPITIAANGAITVGTCEHGSLVALLHPPAGSLTINRSCHVTGSITYSVCNSTCAANYVCTPDCVNNQVSVQVTPSLWRSGDGTRLSGTALNACTVIGPACIGSYIYPMEFIDGQ
jgi:hypothetical protein